MELCGPNMSESGGSLCQVKQLPCHSVSPCRLQASGHNMRNLPHQPWVNHPAPAVASSPAVAIRHRVTGAMAASCGSPECAASRLGEVAALARGVSSGKVLVTGGGGYFGFRLGRELASQGMSVVLLDMNKPPCDVPDGATFYQVLRYLCFSNFPCILLNNSALIMTIHFQPIQCSYTGHTYSETTLTLAVVIQPYSFILFFFVATMPLHFCLF